MSLSNDQIIEAIAGKTMPLNQRFARMCSK